MSAITPGYGETKCFVCKKGFENGTEIRRSVSCGHSICRTCLIHIPSRVSCYVDGCTKKIHRYQWLKETYWTTNNNRNRSRSTSNYFSQDRLETDNSKGLTVFELVNIFESTRINDSSNIRLPKKLKPIDVTKRDFTQDIEHTLDFPNVKSFKYSGTKPVTDQIQYAPYKPNNLKAFSKTQHEIDLYWDPPRYGSRPTKYILQQQEFDYDEWIPIVEVDSNTTCFHVKNLQPDTKYYFRVFSENEAGRSVEEKMYDFCKTKCTAPLMPTNIRILSETSTSITIKWDVPDESPKPTSFQIKVKDSTTSNIINVYNSYTKEYVIESLIPNRRYEFCIAAENSGGTSSVAYKRHKTIADDIQSTANETKSVTVTPCGDKSSASRKRSLHDEIGHQSSQNDTNGHGSVSASKVSRYGAESNVDGIRGLPNVGMTCYANSIFQVLAQTPNLVSHLQFLQKTNKLKTNSLTKSLLDVLKDVNSISTDIDNIHRKYETVPRNNVYGLVSKVINSDSSFQIGRQNDSHSFLISMFNAIKSDISYKDTKGVLSMFEGELMSRFTYPCKHVEVSEPQMFNSLLIPIDDYEAEWRIEDGIRSLLKEERFRHDLLPCGKCNISDCDTITRKTMEFNQLPDVLILQLGRFKQQHRRLEKIYKTVHYRHTLEPKILKPNMGSHDRKCYRLYGVTLHSGSLSGGHYTAYVRCIDTVNGGEDQWYDCSDSYVQKIPKDSVLNDKHAFLLFYHLEETADSISF